MNKGIIHAYGLGLSAGLAVMLWMMTNLVTVKEFRTHIDEENRRWAAHDSRRDETLRTLQSDIERVRRSVERIEGILLKDRVDSRAAAGKRIPND